MARRVKNRRYRSSPSFRGAAQSREPGIQKQTRSTHLDSGSGAVAPSRDDKVLVARFGAPHGVRGEIKLWSFTQDPLAIADYGPLESADGRRTFEIESLRAAKDFLVARVAGVADRAAAEALRNVELYVARDRLPAIEDEETWYYADLVGLTAFAPGGEKIGTVTAVHNFGAGEVIELAPAEGGPTIMLPFTETAVPEVNVKAGRMIVVVPAETEAVVPADPRLDRGESRDP